MPRITALAMDVDGVLTDGSVWWGPNGEEWKRFCFADIMGLSLARKEGFVLALISGEDSPLVRRLAAKVHIEHVALNCKEKGAALTEFVKRYDLKLEEVCFMGDDVNDIPALEIAGLSAAPSNAQPAVLAKCEFVTQASGGNGAVRELVNHLLASQCRAASSSSTV
jgi:3-deoxy-D-manno-octulosonate 8-phosphate phosphatase (KDO 8-P phosphatase)